MTIAEPSTSCKACTQCGSVKPLSHFAQRASAPDGLRYDCRDCQAEKSRGYLLRRRFGITAAEYDRMLAEQGGGCALCRRSAPGGRWTSFAVDHCHETGRVRGLLCYFCNYALGVLGDSPESLRRAYEYVRG